jgi:hypothetical protein
MHNRYDGIHGELDRAVSKLDTDRNQPRTRSDAA